MLFSLELGDVNGQVTYADMDFLRSVYANNGTYDPETERQIYERSLEWMTVRKADENFVLDTILDKTKKGAGTPFCLIDSDKIGLFGHSMGGASSKVYGTRIVEAMDEMTDELSETIPNWQYVNFYLGENAVDYRGVMFHEAGHLNFTDLPLISPVFAKFLGVGDVDAKACIENVNQVVLAWFDHYLKDKEELNIKPEY